MATEMSERRNQPQKYDVAPPLMRANDADVERPNGAALQPSVSRMRAASSQHGAHMMAAPRPMTAPMERLRRISGA